VFNTPVTPLDYFPAKLRVDSARVRESSQLAPSEHEGFYASLTCHGSAKAWASVLALCSKTTGGLQTVALAAWALFQAKLAREEEIVFGVVLDAQRSPNSAASSSASSARPCTLRVRIDRGQTTAGLLSEVAEACAALSALQHASPERYPASISSKPAFEVVVDVAGLTASGAKSGQGEGAGDQDSRSVPRAPLELRIFDAQGLRVQARYDFRRHSAERVERWVEALLCSIERLAQLPGTTTPTEVDVLSPKERARLVHEFNRTEHPFSEHALISDAFEARAQIHPNQLAVETDAVCLSYAELDARANRLAHLLLEKNSGSKSPVAVRLRRGADLIVALLATVKAGVPYLPLDSSYPPERVRRVLQQSGAALVITQSEFAKDFDLPTVTLDGADAARLAAMPTTRPARRSVSTDTCYVIFTSGTTGGPKGVVLSHRAVVNTLEWVNRTFEVGPGDRLLFVNTPCFDLSVYDVFGALSAGATVVVASEALLAEPVNLAHALTDKRISIWNSAPAALQRLVEHLPAPPTTLRLVLLSGDWIPLTLPTALHRLQGVRVVSLGGATEAAIWSNWFPVDRVDPHWTSIPYGKPIQNARYYVLDERLAPVPMGAKGDLYIGGVCLADGYLANPELTRERFIADPFCPGQRLYKTGDWALHREDGNLELLGRSDLQVKIRGFRVELAEVEAALRSIPQITHAVCEARTDESGQRSLVAHIVAEAGAIVDERTLRESLAKLLPAYMLPSRFLFHSAQLSCNGKLDRHALCAAPELCGSRQPLAITSSGTEQELVTLWQRLLGRQAIGVNENFFELGGHSLLAALLVARIRERLGVELPVAQVLENPTITSLARGIEAAASLSTTVPHIHSYHPTGNRPPLVLIPGLLGTVFTFRALPALLGSNQPTHVVDFLGNYQQSVADFRSIEAIAEHLEPHVIPLLEGGRGVLGGFSFGAAAAYELCARLTRKGYSVPLLFCFDGRAPGHPKKLPLSKRVMALGRSLARVAEADIQSGRSEHALSRRVATMAERIKQWVYTPAAPPLPDVSETDPELDRHLKNMAQAQHEAYTSYAPNFRQSLDMVLVKAGASAARGFESSCELESGWSDYIDGKISTVTLPTDHLRLFDDSNLPIVAQAIREHIDGCFPSGSSDATNA
jgi:amino acid adenylation domain-containing protein